MLNDLLFELGTEELPSGAVLPLAEALAFQLKTALEKENIPHGDVHSFATPRRLAVLIHDVQTMQGNQKISRRGPAITATVSTDGHPHPALLGFANSCGVSVNDLTTLKTDKGSWWMYEAEKPGAKTCDLLPGLINQAVAALPIPKPMRWGAGDALFARPVHWAILLFGDEMIDAQVLGVKTGRHTVGHRFHGARAIRISSPRDYEQCLKDAFVIADFATRRQMIVDQIQQIAKEHEFQPIMPESLLDEVTSIVEWPQALLAHFEPEFLEVPSEALIAAMQSHQKCFALRDKHQQLLPHFIAVANIVSTHPEQVILGNEKVMRARLSDAAFFFRQDQRQALYQYREGMKNVVFQARLGSLEDKVNRLNVLMEHWVDPLQLNRAQAIRAAELSKCDLMTGMVGEFPELQGLMGYYYAMHDKEEAAVAQALNEQYMPRFAGDELPHSSLGLALSLADRLDTLVGAFSIGQKPTGDKDPFKLRRHALAVVRLLLSTQAALNVSTLIQDALRGYGDLPAADSCTKELKPFILDRLNSYYQSLGVSQEIVQAVRARQEDWLYDLDKRVQALLGFIKRPEAVSLSAACKRVNNLLQQASNNTPLIEVDKNKLVEAAEKTLFEQIITVEQQISPLYSCGDYSQILSKLASLHDPVDHFFEHVMVMVDDHDIKQNRLSLLARLQQLLQGVADISLLQLQQGP